MFIKSQRMWLAVVVLVTAVASGSVRAEIQRFHEVNKNLYRGSQPDDIDLVLLKFLGIKSIINLRKNTEAIEHERQVAKELDLNYYSFPMSYIKPPSDEYLIQILDEVVDKDNFPVFIHCRHGKDRTGLVVGLYRVYRDKWPARKAWKEMRKIGFAPALAGLTYAFWSNVTPWERDFDDYQNFLLWYSRQNPVKNPDLPFALPEYFGMMH